MSNIIAVACVQTGECFHQRAYGKRHLMDAATSFGRAAGVLRKEGLRIVECAKNFQGRTTRRINMPATHKDITGNRYGRWIVVAYAGRGYGNRPLWLCKCDCGNEKIVYGPNLLYGKSKSCGCLCKELSSAASTIHGASKNGKKITEYVIHNKIKGRCFNPADAAYWMYGKRGITLCDGWKSFPQFYKDMGPRPPKLSIDRINNEIGYTCGKCEQCIKNGWPMNCRWATAKQQCNNRRSSRRITIGNVTKGMSEWAECWDVSPQLVWSRLANGVTPEQLYARYSRETEETKTT